MPSKRIGILNGGGDCAGLNAVIASIVKSGTDEGYEFVGIIKGAEGLLEPVSTMPLDLKAVSGISHLGGTILSTTNKGRFAAKSGSGDVNQIDPAILNEAKANVEKLGLECVISIGGDGTLTGMLQLQQIGVNVIAVPKTIDNDLSATDKTFGFSSAVEFVADALDRLNTTATSHNRVLLVETMGRNAGWIALYGGVAGGAEMILIPEFPFSYDKIIEYLRNRRAKGKDFSIIVVAEGATAAGGGQATTAVESKKENVLGGISNVIMQEIESRVPGEFEMRSNVLGHLQRGGSPNAEDRILAQRFGVEAMRLAKEGKYGQMVTIVGDRIGSVDIASAVDKIKLVTEDHDMVKTAKELLISFGV
jgi:phosphofructokinase-like protein